MLCFAVLCVALLWPPGLFPTEAVSEVRVPGPAQPVRGPENGEDQFNEPLGFYFGPASMFAPPGQPFVPPLSFFPLPFLQKIDAGRVFRLTCFALVGSDSYVFLVIRRFEGCPSSWFLDLLLASLFSIRPMY